MKVEVVQGFQVVDKHGKPHSSGVIDMDAGDAEQALVAGWVTKPTPKKATAVKKTATKK